MSKPVNPDLWRHETREGVNQDRVRLLVEAARSGDYAQAIHYLCKITYTTDADGSVADAPRECFCILGLAIEVARDNGLDCVAHEDVKYVSTGETVRSYWCGPRGADWMTRDETDTELPSCVREWYGFDSGLPTVLMPNGNADELAALNDAGWPFADLANFIAFTYLDPIPGGDDAGPQVDAA